MVRCGAVRCGAVGWGGAEEEGWDGNGGVGAATSNARGRNGNGDVGALLRQTQSASIFTPISAIPGVPVYTWYALGFLKDMLVVSPMRQGGAGTPWVARP